MSGAPHPAPDEHAALAPLLGAWLLDACSAAESSAVAAHVERCAACTTEVRELYPAVASLAARAPHEAESPYESPYEREAPYGEAPYARPVPLGGASRPSRRSPRPAAYDRLASRVRTRRPPAPRDVPAHVRPYTDHVATLDAVLRDLGGAEWRAPTVEGWSVAQLVAHLAATDSLLTGALDATARGPLDLPGTTVPARTRSYTDWAARQPPEAVRAAWRAQADALHGVLVRGADEAAGAGSAHAPEDRLSFAGGPPLAVADHTTGRAFETWIHTRDIALATGRRLPPPAARNLTRMCALGVRLLPLALRMRGTPLGERVLRVDLSGRGGGTWLVGEAGEEAPSRPPDAGLALGSVEFCLLVGGRLDPAETVARARVTGAAALAEAALTAAPAFAGP
ncbi:maleylpyruvate isomerase family mycothiol-dependent enzyme [Streptomyces sp. G45]|uniref:maleylpyruvate isomerase family mycothiol-dependent enzyme n=1 Tax=Streptomyces sp. G45 TaxID=3406627 RepID=UPI003C167A66